MTTILLVEDDPILARCLQAIWETDGHTVRTVTDHFEWVTEPGRYLWHGIEMLVTDLNLDNPHISGLDILLFCELHHPLIRRGVLSGLAPPDARHASPLYAAAISRAHVVMHKPTDYTDLLAAVR